MKTVHTDDSTMEFGKWYYYVHTNLESNTISLGHFLNEPDNLSRNYDPSLGPYWTTAEMLNVNLLSASYRRAGLSQFVLTLCPVYFEGEKQFILFVNLYLNAFNNCEASGIRFSRAGSIAFNRFLKITKKQRGMSSGKFKLLSKGIQAERYRHLLNPDCFWRL